MSEYEQTQRRFDKLKATFDHLIEQNSYKKLRADNEKLREDRRKMFHEIDVLKNTIDAQERILASLEDIIKELRAKEIKEQVRVEDIPPATAV